MITDAHAHLFWGKYDEDLEEVIDRAHRSGVERMIVVGTELETSRKCFEISVAYAGLHPTAGIHPHAAEGLTPETLREIEILCRRDDCVAVGETGLDYFKEYSPRADQRKAFRWHLELAKKLEKPVVVHCRNGHGRDAHADTLELLREAPGVQAMMHCYSMGPEELGSYLELGCYVSFAGSVTYPKNEAILEAARRVPADRLLVETDCPFLAPQGQRGKRNEPAMVREILAFVAEARETSLEGLAETTSENARRLFKL